MGDLHVVPEARRKGVARAQTAAVEDLLREKAACGYQLTMTPGAEVRHGLRLFCESLGFGSEGRTILVRKI